MQLPGLVRFRNTNRPPLETETGRHNWEVRSSWPPRHTNFNFPATSHKLPGTSFHLFLPISKIPGRKPKLEFHRNHLPPKPPQFPLLSGTADSLVPQPFITDFKPQFN
jgi:hypothetical protein